MNPSEGSESAATKIINRSSFFPYYLQPKHFRFSQRENPPKKRVSRTCSHPSQRSFVPAFTTSKPLTHEPTKRFSSRCPNMSQSPRRKTSGPSGTLGSAPCRAGVSATLRTGYACAVRLGQSVFSTTSPARRITHSTGFPKNSYQKPSSRAQWTALILARTVRISYVAPVFTFTAASGWMSV